MKYYYEVRANTGVPEPESVLKAQKLTGCIFQIVGFKFFQAGFCLLFVGILYQHQIKWLHRLIILAKTASVSLSMLKSYKIYNFYPKNASMIGNRLKMSLQKVRATGKLPRSG